MTLARSLQKHGVTVDVASFSSSPAIASRAIRELRRVPHPGVDPAGFFKQLRDFIRQGGYDMVIPADDQALMALAEHYNDLKDLAYIACPPPETSALILDKASSLELAQKCGIRIPVTRLISNSGQLQELVSSFPPPWVLKPVRKELSIEEIKSLNIATRDEISIRFPYPREFSPPMLVQEYCEGIGVGIEILLHEGECRAVFQHRRLKEYPYTGGFSVTAVAERPDPVLVEQSLTLLRALRWEGPAMIEFKVDPRDGRAVFMEVNGRYWGTISLPIFAGIDFPLYHWQLVHGELPTVPAEYSVETKWRWTAGHVWRVHGLLLAARRSGAARKELLTYLHLPSQFDPPIRNALMTPSDPIPAILDLLQIVKFLVWDDIKTLVRYFRRGA